MGNRPSRRTMIGRSISIASAFFAVIELAPRCAGATNAHFLHGAGAIDESMGGSTIAAPQDTIGSLYNNVGNLTQIPGTRVDFALEFILDPSSVKSELGPFRGKTDSDNDFGIIPAFGVSHTPEGSDTTFFLGALGVSGFGCDLPGDDSNPVLRPQIENGQNTGGFGSIYSFYQLLRITGGMAMKVTPALSIGFAPAINYATLSLKPFPATDPDCTAQGVCAYPDAGSAPALGAGALLGIHYRWSDTVSLGLGYTSPQWFTKFHFNSKVENPELETFGKGRDFDIRVNAPQSVQFGIGWQATPELLLTSSGKWMNLANTKGFEDTGFDSKGRLRGFGWSNIWSAGVGAQLHATPELALRIGYNFAENPIEDEISFFSTPAPAAVQHNLTVGVGYDVTKVIQVNLGYYHGFKKSVSGPFISPVAGPIPGSKVESTLSEHSMQLQVSLRL